MRHCFDRNIRGGERIVDVRSGRDLGIGHAPRAMPRKPKALHRTPRALHRTPRALHRTPRALHRTPRAFPLGFVVVAFQAGRQMRMTTIMTNNVHRSGMTGPLLTINRALTLLLAASVRRKAVARVRSASGRNEDCSKSVQRSAN